MTTPRPPVTIGSRPLAGAPQAGPAALADGDAAIALGLGQTPDGQAVTIEVTLAGLSWLSDLAHAATLAQARLSAFLPVPAAAP